MSAVAERIFDLLAKDRLPQGLLFVGPETGDRRAVALDLAASILCPTPSQHRACGSCESCRKIEPLMHPDLRLVEPEKKEIKIDQIRQLHRWIHVGPHEASQKIAILEQADLLNISASNALLKTLEEPPPHAVVILLVRATDNLLPTVLSRLQQFRFPPLPPEPTTRDNGPKWLTELGMLLEGQIPSSPAAIFSIRDGIGKEPSALRTFFSVIQRRVREEIETTQAEAPESLRVRQMDRLFDLARTMEKETLQRYGNTALCLDRLLLDLSPLLPLHSRQA